MFSTSFFDLTINQVNFYLQPSKSKEEFKQLAAKFQLGWNFLLTAVSKAMTLSHMDSFGKSDLCALMDVGVLLGHWQPGLGVTQVSYGQPGSGAMSRIQVQARSKS